MKRVRMDIEDSAKKLRDAQAQRDKRAKTSSDKAAKKAAATAKAADKAKNRATAAAERAAAKRGPTANKTRFGIFHLNFNIPRVEEFTVPDACLTSDPSVTVLTAAHKSFCSDDPVVLHVRAPVQAASACINVAIRDFERDLVRPGVTGPAGQARNGRALKCRSDIVAAAELLQVGLFPVIIIC